MNVIQVKESLNVKKKRGASIRMKESINSSNAYVSLVKSSMSMECLASELGAQRPNLTRSYWFIASGTALASPQDWSKMRNIPDVESVHQVFECIRLDTSML